MCNAKKDEASHPFSFERETYASKFLYAILKSMRVYDIIRIAMKRVDFSCFTLHIKVMPELFELA